MDESGGVVGSGGLGTDGLVVRVHVRMCVVGAAAWPGCLTSPLLPLSTKGGGGKQVVVSFTPPLLSLGLMRLKGKKQKKKEAGKEERRRDGWWWRWAVTYLRRVKKER